MAEDGCSRCVVHVAHEVKLRPLGQDLFYHPIDGNWHAGARSRDNPTHFTRIRKDVMNRAIIDLETGFLGRWTF